MIESVSASQWFLVCFGVTSVIFGDFIPLSASHVAEMVPRIEWGDLNDWVYLMECHVRVLLKIARLVVTSEVLTPSHPSPSLRTAGQVFSETYDLGNPRGNPIG